MRISDWSSDVCSSDLTGEPAAGALWWAGAARRERSWFGGVLRSPNPGTPPKGVVPDERAARNSGACPVPRRIRIVASEGEIVQVQIQPIDAEQYQRTRTAQVANRIG